MKPIIASLYMLALSVAAFGETNMHLANGVTVQTADGVYVQLDGDCTDDGTSYLSGEITSGDRSGCTSFSGLTLSSGVTGTITCCTGSVYDKGNGEPANFKRWYEISNTGGSDLTTTMSITYVNNGTNDERNGLSTGPYYILKHVNPWTTYANETTAPPPISAENVLIPDGVTSDWILSNQQPIGIELVSFTAMLEFGAVRLKWETASEINHAGFNVLRSTEKEGAYEKANQEFIAAKGKENKGAAYEYLDFPSAAGVYFFKLEDVSLDGRSNTSEPIAVELVTGVLTRRPPPKDFELLQNYPNPFNPQTTVEFGIPQSGQVQVAIYNVRGELVRCLVNDQLPAGTYLMIWDGLDFSGMRAPSGMYVYRMVSGDFIASKKLTLAR
jgi:hypothetical protein